MEYDHSRPQNTSQKNNSSQSTVVVEEDEILLQQAQSGNGAVLEGLSHQGEQGTASIPVLNPWVNLFNRHLSL